MDSAATRQNIKQDVHFICRLAEGDVDLQHLLEVVRPLRYLYLATEFSDCSQPYMNITRIAHFVAKSRKPDVACSIGLDHSSTEILMACNKLTDCLQPDKNITRIVLFRCRTGLKGNLLPSPWRERQVPNQTSEEYYQQPIRGDVISTGLVVLFTCCTYLQVN